MAGDTIITVVGNLTADPEMRFTPPPPAAPRTTRGPRAAPPPSVTSPRSKGTKAVDHERS